MRSERRVHLQTRRLRQDRLRPEGHRGCPDLRRHLEALPEQHELRHQRVPPCLQQEALPARPFSAWSPHSTMEDIEPGRAGVRAMLLGTDGNMVDDFRIERQGRSHPRAQRTFTSGHGRLGHRRADRRDGGGTIGTWGNRGLVRLRRSGTARSPRSSSRGSSPSGRSGASGRSGSATSAPGSRHPGSRTGRTP